MERRSPKLHESEKPGTFSLPCASPPPSFPLSVLSFVFTIYLFIIFYTVELNSCAVEELDLFVNWIISSFEFHCSIKLHKKSTLIEFYIDSYLRFHLTDTSIHGVLSNWTLRSLLKSLPLSVLSIFHFLALNSFYTSDEYGKKRASNVSYLSHTLSGTSVSTSARRLLKVFCWQCSLSSCNFLSDHEFTERICNVGSLLSPAGLAYLAKSGR